MFGVFGFAPIDFPAELWALQGGTGSLFGCIPINCNFIRQLNLLKVEAGYPPAVDFYLRTQYKLLLIKTI